MATELETSLCLEQHTNRWPGTTLGGDQLAWVRWYRLTRQSAKILQSAERLFEWSSPKLPEDLTFYTEEGFGWVGSISHEQIGWIDLRTSDGTLDEDFQTRLAGCIPDQNG
jgi:hypothetical protein